MNYLEKDKLYCSQGDTSGKHEPKKNIYWRRRLLFI